MVRERLTSVVRLTVVVATDAAMLASRCWTSPSGSSTRSQAISSTFWAPEQATLDIPRQKWSEVVESISPRTIRSHTLATLLAGWVQLYRRNERDRTADVSPATARSPVVIAPVFPRVTR